eukprot:1159686-Pelagomonas_calceolata.AAC.4
MQARHAHEAICFVLGWQTRLQSSRANRCRHARAWDMRLQSSRANKHRHACTSIQVGQAFSTISNAAAVRLPLLWPVPS